MSTHRSEAITHYRNGNPSVHRPTSEYDSQNKKEHYAVLAQVIDNGLTEYIEHTYAPEGFIGATSLLDLTDMFIEQVNAVVGKALISEEFKVQFAQLHSSQVARHTFDELKPDNVSAAILAGTKTFARSFMYIFDMLQRHYGVDVAGMPENWHIADRLAKLDFDQFSAYYSTYVTDYRLWSSMVEHFKEGPDGGFRFKAEYPEDAYVTEAAADPTRINLKLHEFSLDGSNPLIQIKDIPSRGGRVGCPITFNSNSVKTLWQLYAAHAHHIKTRQPLLSLGGNEAFHQ